MAAGRMLRRVIGTSWRVAALKNDTHRVIYTWLIPFLDVEGRCKADPRIIKGYVCPLLDHITPHTIEAALRDMAALNLIELYVVDGNKYLQYYKFADNQSNLRKDRETPSKIPPPQPEGSNSGATPEQLRSNDGVTPAQIKLNKVKLSKVKLNKEKGPQNLHQKKEGVIKQPKKQHGEAVLLSPIEYQKLQETIGKESLDIGIEKLNYSITVKGGKYKDHYLCLLNWYRRGFLTNERNHYNGKTTTTTYQKTTNFKPSPTELPTTVLTDIAEINRLAANKRTDAYDKRGEKIE